MEFWALLGAGRGGVVGGGLSAPEFTVLSTCSLSLGLGPCGSEQPREELGLDWYRGPQDAEASIGAEGWGPRTGVSWWGSREESSRPGAARRPSVLVEHGVLAMRFLGCYLVPGCCCFLHLRNCTPGSPILADPSAQVLGASARATASAVSSLQGAAAGAGTAFPWE